jgi:hypothetical protein
MAGAETENKTVTVFLNLHKYLDVANRYLTRIKFKITYNEIRMFTIDHHYQMPVVNDTLNNDEKFIDV